MPSPADTTGRRLALLIATSDYNDPALRQLRSPGRDARDLATVLANPEIGDFEVQTLVNASSGVLQEGIEDFCSDRSPDDQLLIYLSCHGVLDDFGRLYYAAVNTRRLRLAATAVPSGWLTERLEDSRARRQIVVLDCCHSGAFARGAKGDAPLALQQRFEPHGRGRVVLTASRSTEYSFEGEQPSGDGVPSIFTKAIVQGLTTGDADRDKDGLITVNDLYRHVYETVRTVESRQTPELWTYGAEGELLVAHSVRGPATDPASLPEDLLVTLGSPRPRVRETGVSELAEILDTGGPGLVLTARQVLERIANEDVGRVASLAQEALHASHGTAAEHVHRELVHRELAERARFEARTRPPSPTPSQPSPPPTQPSTPPSQPVTPPPSPPSRAPETPPIPQPSAPQVTWRRRLVGYVRFWFGLALILAGTIPLLANVPYHYGYEKYPSVTNLHLYIELGLTALLVVGVLLVLAAAISASAVPRNRR